jgi:hypothetical protein
MRQVLRSVAGKSLPIIFILMNGTLIVEQLIRHRKVGHPWRDVYLPLMVAEPVLMAFGIGVAIVLLRATRFEHLGRHVAAALIALGILMVVSIRSQGAHMPFIIGASVAAGLLAGIIAFWPFVPRRMAVQGAQ